MRKYGRSLLPQITVRLPDELVEKLRLLADKHDRTHNGEIVRAIRYYVAQFDEDGDALTRDVERDEAPEPEREQRTA